MRPKAHLGASRRRDRELSPRSRRVTGPGRAHRGASLLGLLALVASLATLAGCLTLRHTPSASSASSAPTSELDAPGAEPYAPAPTFDPSSPAPALRYAALNRLLAERLRAAGEDCDAVAVAVDEWTLRHADEFRHLQDEVDAWEAQANPRRIERFFDALFPEIDARVEAGARCASDPKARAAFDRFFSAVGFDSDAKAAPPRDNPRRAR